MMKATIDFLFYRSINPNPNQLATNKKFVCVIRHPTAESMRQRGHQRSSHSAVRSRPRHLSNHSRQKNRLDDLISSDMYIPYSVTSIYLFIYQYPTPHKITKDASRISYRGKLLLMNL